MWYCDRCRHSAGLQGRIDPQHCSSGLRAQPGSVIQNAFPQISPVKCQHASVALLFSTSPACLTNIPSFTNKSWVTKSKNIAGGLTGSKNDDSNRRAFQSLLNKKKNTKSSGGLGGGGSPPHDVRRSDDSNRVPIQSLQKV